MGLRPYRPPLGKRTELSAGRTPDLVSGSVPHGSMIDERYAQLRAQAA